RGAGAHHGLRTLDPPGLRTRSRAQPWARRRGPDLRAKHRPCWTGPALTPSARRGAPRLPSGEQAATEEGALERPVAVHAATAEAAGLAGGEQPGDRLAGGVQRAPVEVGLDAAQRLAGQHVQ